MRNWRPRFSFGGIIALLLTLTAWTVVAWLATMLPGPVSGRTFWLGLGVFLFFSLGVIFFYWCIAFFSLRYTFDRNGLILRWAWARQVIPMNRITLIRRWRKWEHVGERGLRWPGVHRGHAYSDELGPVTYYATAGPSGQVLICTADGTWVISPRHPSSFIEEMEIRRNMGTTRQLDQEVEYWWILGWNTWRDRVFWGILGLGLLVNLSLLALLCHRYPTLPPLIPIHFTTIPGEGIVADIIGQKQDLFKLPAFGLVVWLANVALGVLLHRRWRLLALFLAVIALIVQVGFWLGALFILFYRRGG